MQKLLNVALIVAVVALGGAVAFLWSERTTLDADAVRAIVAETAVAEPAPVDFNSAVQAALLDNPRILQEVNTALEAQIAAEEAEATRVALAGLGDSIQNDPANVVLGNPEGSVTLVELFDYNCTYCRQVVPDVLDLIAENPDLRVILREFPILSAGSVEAARVAVLVNQSEVDYTLFHTALMAGRGTIDANAALDAAASLGLDRSTLQSGMAGAEVTAALERTYAVARELGLSGTPTFIIGDQVIPGALSGEELQRMISAMRDCGSTTCPVAEG